MAALSTAGMVRAGTLSRAHSSPGTVRSPEFESSSGGALGLASDVTIGVKEDEGETSEATSESKDAASRCNDAEMKKRDQNK